MGQVGIEDVDGCSEGFEGASCKNKERMDMGCPAGIDAGSEDGVKGGRRDGIEDGFEDDVLTSKELPERARRILATHEDLMVTDLKESLAMVYA
jgi:hypothetical protein